MNWAYIAGILDGEGCIGIYHHKVTNRSNNLPNFESIIPRISITNTSKELVDYLLLTKLGRMKKYHYNGRNCKDRYDWEISSPIEIKEFLLKIKDFLIVKKYQCELMLSFLEERVIMTKFRDSMGRIKKMDITTTTNWYYYERMKRLNKRGIGKTI